MTRHAEQFCEIRAGGGSVEFFVGWFLKGGNSGDAFEPELLARLGALDIRLSLDIYPLPEEDAA